MGARSLRLEITRRNAVIPVKLDVIEGGGDSKPAGRPSGFCPAHMSHRCNDDVAESQRPADQYDFKLDRGANRQLPGGSEIDAGRTDITGDKSNRKFFWNSAS